MAAQDILSSLDSAESETQAAEALSSKEFDERTKIRDRSKIAKWIIILFAGTVCLTLVFIITGVIVEYASSTPVSPPRWLQGGQLAKEILSSILLPVVTLVIGFYFGTEAKK